MSGSSKIYKAKQDAAIAKRREELAHEDRLNMENGHKSALIIIFLIGAFSGGIAVAIAAFLFHRF
jgi:hypothetical protein